MNQSKFYLSCFDSSISNDSGNVSLIKTPLKYGISSSCAHVDNSIFVNALSGILRLNMHSSAFRKSRPVGV